MSDNGQNGILTVENNVFQIDEIVGTASTGVSVKQGRSILLLTYMNRENENIKR